MFLLVSVSIQSSINLGKTFPQISRIRIIPSSQILARVFVYLLPFISQILDFICPMVLIFISIYFAWRESENQQYWHPPSHLPSQQKKISGFENTFFFSFHLCCCKNENLWWFSPYPVTTTIIWPTTDRIPHSLIFKRMQIKRIADNIRAFSFLLTNWNKEPDEERIYRGTEFFHKLDNKKWKMRTGARATKQNYISIYISLYMKSFLKTGVYIYICLDLIRGTSRNFKCVLTIWPLTSIKSSWKWLVRA